MFNSTGYAWVSHELSLMEKLIGFKTDAHENKPQNCMEDLTSKKNTNTSENQLIKKVSIQISIGIYSHFFLFIIYVDNNYKFTQLHTNSGQLTIIKTIQNYKQTEKTFGTVHHSTQQSKPYERLTITTKPSPRIQL